MSYERYKDFRLAPSDNGCYDVLSSDYDNKGTYPSRTAAKRAIDEMTSPTSREDQRATFSLLWDMVNTIRSNPERAGTVIGRYANMIDDRIENSGYSRSVDSLRLYAGSQLEEELERREGEQS